MWYDVIASLHFRSKIQWLQIWFLNFLYGKSLAPLNMFVTSSEKFSSSLPYGTQDSYCYGDDVVVGMNLSYFRSAGQHRLHVCNIKCPRHPSLSNPRQLCFWGHRDYPCHCIERFTSSICSRHLLWWCSMHEQTTDLCRAARIKCDLLWFPNVRLSSNSLLNKQQWTCKKQMQWTSFCANLLLRQLILQMMLACPAVAFWAWNVEMMVVVVLVVLAPLRLSWGDHVVVTLISRS